MSLSIKQKQIHRHKEETCECQWGKGWKREGLGVWGYQMQTNTSRMDKQYTNV